MENKNNIKTSTEKLPITTKKQKFIGFKEFIDAETGEVIPMQLNQVEDRDFNFHKLWLQMFINGLDKIANKKMRLAFWIIDHLNKDNLLIYTFRRMAEETGLSIETVIKTMNALQKGDPPFLKKMQSGVYMINPDILYKGSHKGRMGIIYQFGEIPSKYALEQNAKTEQHEQAKTSPDASESPQTHETTFPQEEPPEQFETIQIALPMKDLGLNRDEKYYWLEGRKIPHENDNDLKAIEIRRLFIGKFVDWLRVSNDIEREKYILEIFRTGNTHFWLAHEGKNISDL